MARRRWLAPLLVLCGVVGADDASAEIGFDFVMATVVGATLVQALDFVSSQSTQLAYASRNGLLFNGTVAETTTMKTLMATAQNLGALPRGTRARPFSPLISDERSSLGALDARVLCERNVLAIYAGFDADRHAYAYLREDFYKSSGARAASAGNLTVTLGKNVKGKGKLDAENSVKYKTPRWTTPYAMPADVAAGVGYTIAAPLRRRGQAAGAAGADVGLSRVSEIIAATARTWWREDLGAYDPKGLFFYVVDADPRVASNALVANGSAAYVAGVVAGDLRVVNGTFTYVISLDFAIGGLEWYLVTAYDADCPAGYEVNNVLLNVYAPLGMLVYSVQHMAIIARYQIDFPWSSSAHTTIAFNSLHAIRCDEINGAWYMREDPQVRCDGDNPQRVLYLAFSLLYFFGVVLGLPTYIYYRVQMAYLHDNGVHSPEMLDTLGWAYERFRRSTTGSRSLHARPYVKKRHDRFDVFTIDMVFAFVVTTLFIYAHSLGGTVWVVGVVFCQLVFFAIAVFLSVVAWGEDTLRERAIDTVLDHVALSKSDESTAHALFSSMREALKLSFLKSKLLQLSAGGRRRGHSAARASGARFNLERQTSVARGGRRRSVGAVKHRANVDDTGAGAHFCLEAVHEHYLELSLRMQEMGQTFKQLPSTRATDGATLATTSAAAYSADSRAVFWRKLAQEFPGMIDFCMTELSQVERTVYFGALLRMERYMQRPVRAQALHYLVEDQDRSSVLYYILAAEEHRVVDLRFCMQSILRSCRYSKRRVVAGKHAMLVPRPVAHAALGISVARSSFRKQSSSAALRQRAAEEGEENVYAHCVD
ncbi:hypothetical protein JL720_10400 [Aureococcus anophagefferens]|nr:hypothetical protein JL720_10400 [Aureococcus anophagefferens]